MFFICLRKTFLMFFKHYFPKSFFGGRLGNILGMVVFENIVRCSMDANTSEIKI